MTGDDPTLDDDVDPMPAPPSRTLRLVTAEEADALAARQSRIAFVRAARLANEEAERHGGEARRALRNLAAKIGRMAEETR